MVDEVVELSGDLVDSVHIGGVQRVLLVDRQVLRLAVDLARPRVDDLDLGVPLPHRLQDGELAPAVDLEVREGVDHGVEVAHLPGQVEQHLLALHQVLHAVAAHVRDVDADLPLVAGQVEEVPPVIRDQAVHRQHLRPQVGQGAAEVAPDEAQAPENQQ